MTDEDWQELAFLNDIELSAMGRDMLGTFLADTEQEMEHPEWYEGPCFCDLCMSYG